MKTYIANVDLALPRHAERLKRAVKVLVVQGVLIVPQSGIWPRDLAPDEENTVVSRIRLIKIYCRACPCPDGRLHSRSVTYWRKREIRRATNKELAVRSIIKHVALAGMCLAPGVLMRRDVLRFGKVGCALVKRRVEIVDFHDDPVRNAAVIVAAVIIRVRWEVTSEWIDPGTRTNLGLVAV